MNDPYANLSYMQVPERIVVVGGDQVITGREPLPEVKLENILLGDIQRNNVIELPTPPHVLTLDQFRPNVNEYGEKSKPKARANLFNDDSNSDLEEALNTSRLNCALFCLFYLR